MRAYVYALLCRAERVCLAMVWLLLLLAFNAPPLAMLTLLCALLHELGHIAATQLLGRRVGTPRGRLHGLLLPVKGTLSYREELLIAAAGPLANVCVALLCLICLPVGREFFSAFATLSLMTALANLLPTRGYDGERMLRCLLSQRHGSTLADGICSALTLGISASLTLLSLYAMLRVGGGFWIFGVFFATLLLHMRRTLDEGKNG